MNSPSTKGQYASRSTYRGAFRIAGLLITVASSSATGVPVLAQQVHRSPPSATSQQMHDALIASERGDLARAFQLTQDMLKNNPKFEPALRLEGMLLEEAGRNAEAAEVYQRALDIDPADSEVAMKLGVFKLVSGNTDEAIKLLTQRTKRAPQDGDAFFYLAQAYHLKGDNDAALAAIQKSLKDDPGNPSVWQKYGELLCSAGENEKGIQWLTKAQQADPSLARLNYDLAVAHYNNQDLENAGQYAAKATAEQPTNLQALALLGAIDVKLSQWANGREVFQKILAVKGDDVPSLLGLGHCELSLKNFSAAVIPLEQLLREDPTMVLAHFYLSRAYAGLGRTQEAEHEAAVHRKLLEEAASPSDSTRKDIEQGTRDQASSLLRAGKEAEAVELFRSRASGDYATPGSPYLLTGTTYLSLDKPTDAVRLLRKALSVEPGIHDAHTYLAIIALQQDDVAAAESELKAALTTLPQDPFATAELGAVRYRQGRWVEAAELLAKSKTVAPFSLYMLADCDFRLGKVKEANVAAELAASYSKDDPKLRQGIIELLSRNQQTELAQKLSAR